MPYEMTSEDRGVYRRFYGHTTDLEVSEAVAIVESSPHFDDVRYVINDFLGVTRFDLVTPSFIDEVAAVDSAAAMTNPNVKVAIVAVDPGILKLAQEYATHELNSYPTRIYSSLDEARAWASAGFPLKTRFRG